MTGPSPRPVFLVAVPYGHIYGSINISFMKFGPPPAGLAYLAAFLRAKGRTVRVFDMQFFRGGWEAFYEAVRTERPGVVGFSSVTPQILTIARVARTVKSIDPGILTVVGGPHPSAMPEDTVAQEGVDFAVVGEGEHTLLELCEGADPAGIKGLCRRGPGGRPVVNEPRPLIEDLDSLPYPAYDLLPHEAYGYFALGRCLTVYSGRGCPFNCTFCSSRVIFKSRYRVNSPEYFVGMLEHFIRKFGVRRFEFGDESFTAKPERVLAICRLIRERELGIRWTCISRVDHITEEIAAALKASGCKMVEIGIESGDPAVLKATRKGITLEQVEAAVAVLDETGLESYGYFLLGLPHETVESMRRTIDFAKRLKLDYAQFGMFVPLPGSKGWDIVQEGLLLKCFARDWDDYLRYATPVVGSEAVTPAVLKEYYKKAMREFYMRPYMVKRVLAKCRSLDELAMFGRMGLTFLNSLVSG